MKSLWKYILGIAIVVLFVGYAFLSRDNENAATSLANSTTSTTSGDSGSMATNIDTSGTGSASTSSGSTGSGSGSTGSSGSGSAGLYKDGTYTGSAADAFYGTIQVEAVISGGKITDVQFLQEPNAPGHTQQVSAMAIPALKEEALTAQSSNVNVVSGATQDSQAFQQSLASALAQAE